MAKPKPCYNYHTLHLSYKGEPSYTCKGCGNREPKDATTESFVLPDGEVNCVVFNENERTIPFQRE